MWIAGILNKIALATGAAISGAAEDAVVDAQVVSEADKVVAEADVSAASCRPRNTLRTGRTMRVPPRARLTRMRRKATST